jgi:peptide/nickel transport system substrate-binding protein
MMTKTELRSAWFGTLAAALLLTTPVSAETMKFAFQGDLKALDQYSLNETFTLGVLANVYEGLTRRNADLEIEPALAESWEIIEPNRWRFHLRKGVKFHNGNDFTADDVVFSAERVRHQNSDLKTRIGPDVKVEKVDDHTVDFVLPGPNPILHYEWDTWGIMDKEWSEEHGVEAPMSPSDTNPSYAALNANGTGPFKVLSHQPGVKTVFEANPDWWNAENASNLDRVEFTPIASDPTRVAALLTGEVDLMDPVPTQDIQRIERTDGVRAMTGPELRTIFLGFDQTRDELLESNVKGKNPFKDERVRKAFYQAIDIETIKDKVMRGLSEPSALLISPQLFERADEFERYPYDPEAAKALLTEAGYPDGFEVGMDCPNDRYVNDEAICQAVAAMLAKIGVKINLNAQPKAQYFAKVLQSGGFDTSFYMLGWTPSSMDSWNVLKNLANCRGEDGSASPFNLGGYCNERVDELTAQILAEIDPEKRNELIAEAYRIIHEDVGFIPLHQQSLAWGVRDNLEVEQGADNQLRFSLMSKKN